MLVVGIYLYAFKHHFHFVLPLQFNYHTMFDLLDTMIKILNKLPQLRHIPWKSRALTVNSLLT